MGKARIPLEGRAEVLHTMDEVDRARRAAAASAHAVIG